jgi:hypothetical protein
MNTVNASQLGEKILSLLGLQPGSEFLLTLTKDGSILVQAGSGSTTREMPSERKRGGSGNE